MYNKIKKIARMKIVLYISLMHSAFVSGQAVTSRGASAAAPQTTNPPAAAAPPVISISAVTAASRSSSAPAAAASVVVVAPPASAPSVVAPSAVAAQQPGLNANTPIVVDTTIADPESPCNNGVCIYRPSKVANSAHLSRRPDSLLQIVMPLTMFSIGLLSYFFVV